MSFLLLKYLHILGASVLFGTGLGIAFFMFWAVRSNSPATIAPVARIVVVADYIFTLTAALIQPISGMLLVVSAGYSLMEDWIVLSLLLYFFIGVCWVPVVFMQIEMSKLADVALAQGGSLPARFYQLYQRWFLLGWPAFVSILVIFYLMIEKPTQIF